MREAERQFVATITHELRTPLNAVLGWARLLTENPDRRTLERGLAVIQRSAKTQARLVDDLTDVSCIISGRLELLIKRTRVASVIHAAVDAVRAAADAKRLDLAMSLQSDIGEALVDPDRLQQIVWHLLSNAVRFTPPDGRVSLCATKLGSSLSISVADTGRWDNARSSEPHLRTLQSAR